MAHTPRKSGIPLVQAVPWGTSLALFYESERDLLDTCAGYFAAGLNANELCLWVLVESVTVEVARRAVPDLAAMRRPAASYCGRAMTCPFAAAP